MNNKLLIITAIISALTTIAVAWINSEDSYDYEDAYRLRNLEGIDRPTPTPPPPHYLPPR